MPPSPAGARPRLRAAPWSRCTVGGGHLYFGGGGYSGSDPAAALGAPLLDIDVALGTYDLGAGSAAIDRGTSDLPVFLTTDFRSVTRPVGAGVDIGAIERLAD